MLSRAACGPRAACLRPLVYTHEPEPDSLSEDNPEVCSAPLTQVLESQCQRFVNLDPAISDNEDNCAISAQVSEFYRDQSVISSVTAYHSWFVKPKRDRLTKYFEFHSHQPETTKFNATNVYFRPDNSRGCLQRLWLSYCEEKEALFCNLCIAYGNTTGSNQNLSKFLTGVNSWKHIYQRIYEHESSQKHNACVEAHMQFSSNKTLVDLLPVSQTLLHKKQVMQRRQILDRVVSIVKMIGKWETIYRGTGSSETVSTLYDEKVDHGRFLEIVLLLTKYDDILKCHWKMLSKNVCKTTGQAQG